jgi:hypothetical protein
MFSYFQSSNCADTRRNRFLRGYQVQKYTVLMVTGEFRSGKRFFPLAVEVELAQKASTFYQTVGDYYCEEQSVLRVMWLVELESASEVDSKANREIGFTSR